MPDSLSNQLVVDCDALPRIPSGLSLEGEGAEHRKMGKVTLEKRADGKLYANGKEVVRHLSPNQQNGKYIQGHKLRKELKDKQVLNACIMDALLANPQLIPDEWKDGYTYFWGTIFRRVVGDLYVEYLYWDGHRWDWGDGWLDHDWSGSKPGRVARKLVLGIMGRLHFSDPLSLCFRSSARARTSVLARAFFLSSSAAW